MGRGSQPGIKLSSTPSSRQVTANGGPARQRPRTGQGIRRGRHRRWRHGARAANGGGWKWAQALRTGLKIAQIRWAVFILFV